MLILTFPSIAFWIIIYFGDTYYHILIARLISTLKNRWNNYFHSYTEKHFNRFLNGLTAGGVQTTTILYISEIANDK